MKNGSVDSRRRPAKGQPQAERRLVKLGKERDALVATLTKVDEEIAKLVSK